jgi:GT2 family glycosyltransferase
MIPPILHQSWMTANVPVALAAYAQQWRDLHPGWHYRLWTDQDLRDLVQREYPSLLDLFDGYPKPIMRVDLARCLILKSQGGVYADLDAEPLRSLDELRAEDRPILFEEPASHVENEFVRVRGFAREVVSNALMLSPPGHPFWDRVVDLMKRCRGATNPLDATGPFLLTAAVPTSPPDERPRVRPAYQLSPMDKYGQPTPPPAGAHEPPLVQHHWLGSWWKTDPAQPIRPPVVPAQTEPPPRYRSWPWRRRPIPIRPPAGDQVLIAIPVRNAATTLEALFQHLLALTHPVEKRTLAFIEGDSTDHSYALLEDFVQQHRAAFRDIHLLRHHQRAPNYTHRWEPQHQRERRSGIARIRNRLLQRALGREDWVLWLDADIIQFPPTLIDDLRAVGAPVVHPNCVQTAGGPSFDLNAWIRERTVSREQMRPYLVDGLFQPPVGHNRLYLSDLRYHDRIPLHSVGGTCLLVAADVHRAGLHFPIRPEAGLIETEAFAARVRAHGCPIIGLPNYEVRHNRRAG